MKSLSNNTNNYTKQFLNKILKKIKKKDKINQNSFLKVFLTRRFK